MSPFAVALPMPGSAREPIRPDPCWYLLDSCSGQSSELIFKAFPNPPICSPILPNAPRKSPIRARISPQITVNPRFPPASFDVSICCVICCRFGSHEIWFFLLVRPETAYRNPDTVTVKNPLLTVGGFPASGLFVSGFTVSCLTAFRLLSHFLERNKRCLPLPVCTGFF